MIATGVWSLPSFRAASFPLSSVSFALNVLALAVKVKQMQRRAAEFAGNRVSQFAHRVGLYQTCSLNSPWSWLWPSSEDAASLWVSSSGANPETSTALIIFSWPTLVSSAILWRNSS